ncbi:MAG: hypothetical protein KJO79_07620 [Verrucomicrobiae bacterium]|nr:hypothetical protein [Verrucomicrobiae bacterium]NNJ87032.1 hypothetical protein [Akkermansiaceae bacterium]
MKQLSHSKILAGTFMLASAWFFSSCAPIPPGAAMQPASPEAGAASNTATAGLRSGDHATTRDSIDRIMKNPKSRPGLGTGWGDEVSSNIGYTSFRRSGSKPAGVSTIYYNDKEGVAAMTGGSWRYTGSGMQRAAGGLVEWGVKSGWSTLKNYNAGRKRYVVGRKGSRYQLVIKNLCHSRLEVVLSVDGLDVMDGRPASFSKRGYIIQPGKTLTVKGFRTSQSAVAAFKFSSVSASYSNLRHGKTRNVGVIGMAVFTEKGIDPWKWSRSAVRQRHAASPFAETPDIRAR